MRVKGRPNGNTKLGRAFRAIEKEYWQDLGGEESLSLSQRRVVEDNVWCDFLVAAMDYELQTKKRLTRKGRPHPLIDLRLRVAAHRRANYQLMGLKRVAKAISWEQQVAEAVAEVQQAEEKHDEEESHG
jgi:hypothetical protein